MTTEQRIREAYEMYSGGYAPEEQEVAYLDFKSGYLALLNELEQFGYAYCYQGQDVCFSTEPQDPSIPTTYYWQEKLYRLPEGETKC